MKRYTFEISTTLGTTTVFTAKDDAEAWRLVNSRKEDIELAMFKETNCERDARLVSSEDIASGDGIIVVGIFTNGKGVFFRQPDFGSALKIAESICGCACDEQLNGWVDDEPDQPNVVWRKWNADGREIRIYELLSGYDPNEEMWILQTDTGNDTWMDCECASHWWLHVHDCKDEVVREWENKEIHIGMFKNHPGAWGDNVGDDWHLRLGISEDWDYTNPKEISGYSKEIECNYRIVKTTYGLLSDAFINFYIAHPYIKFTRNY